MEPKDRNENCNNQTVDENEEIVVQKGWSKFYITVEPIKLVLGFTIAFTGGVTIDLLQRNICQREYVTSFAECTSTNTSKLIKADVEGKTAQINMMKNIIEGIMPLFLVLFIGPWSDTNGRKPCLIWAQRGYVLYYLLWGIFSFFPHLPVMYFFAPSILLGCTGAITTIIICTTSYLSDNFDPDERTLRFGISFGMIIVGILIGNSLAEQVVTWGGEYGFPVVYMVSFLVSLISLMYTMFILEETVISNQVDRTKNKKLVDLQHIKSIIDTVIIRPEKGRWLIFFVLMALISEGPAHAGDEAITYLVGKSHFSWSLGQYNLFAGVSAFIGGIAPVIGIWLLMDILNLSNALILMLSSIGCAILQMLRALSENEIMFWLATMIMKTAIIGSAVDAELADTVSESNVGKAFTFVSLMNALSPLIAIPAYTQVYKSLLPDRTLYVYFISCGLYSITAVGSICLYLKKKQVQYIQPPIELSAANNANN